MAALVERGKHLVWNSDERRLRAPYRIVGQFVVLLLALSIGAFIVDLFDGAEHWFVTRTSYVVPFLAIGLMYIAALTVGSRLFDRRPLRNYGLSGGTEWRWEYLLGFFSAAVLVLGAFAFQLAFGWAEIQGLFVNRTDYSFVLVFVSMAVGVAFLLVFQLANAAYVVKNAAEGLSGYVSLPQAIMIAVGIRLVIGVFLFSSNPGATNYALLVEMVLQLILLISYVYTGRVGFAAGFATGWSLLNLLLLGGYTSGLTAQASILSVEFTGPEAITGGVFGLDGGLLGLFAAVFGLFLLFGWLRLSDNLDVPEIVHERREEL